MTMDAFEKVALSTSMGFNSVNTHTNLGVVIDNATLVNTKTQSFAIPLIGCLNTSKLIPAFITDIEIDLTLNNIKILLSMPLQEPLLLALLQLVILSEMLN